MSMTTAARSNATEAHAAAIAIIPRNASAHTRHSLAQVIRRLVAILRRWHRRYTSRQQLARCDAWLLRDIGISPGEALHEADKPFWRP